MYMTSVDVTTAVASMTLTRTALVTVCMTVNVRITAVTVFTISTTRITPVTVFTILTMRITPVTLEVTTAIVKVCCCRYCAYHIRIQLRQI